jgi:hypothetical protein
MNKTGGGEDFEGDIFAFTPDASNISGISYAMDADIQRRRGKFRDMLDRDKIPAKVA